MSHKNIVLNSDDLSQDRLGSLLELLINSYKNKHKLKNSDIKILDWGSGRGRTFYLLNKFGYDCYGVEIDSALIEVSKLMARQNNLDYKKIFLFNGEKTNFPSNYFDIIITEDVIEHIENIESFYSEIARIMNTRGFSYNRFPAKYTISEVHLKMPFLHWLPKNRLRKIYIKIFLKFNLGARWNVANRAEYYYKYTMEKTFYRDLSFHKKIANKNNLTIKYIVSQNPLLIQHFKKMNLNFLFFRKIAEFISIRFFTVQFYLTRK